jgi:hypothetical protein
VSGHRPFTELTSKFSPKRKARVALRVAELKAEIALAESRNDPSPLGEKSLPRT